MQKIFILTVLTVTLFLQSMNADEEPMLILNMEDQEMLPIHFRTTGDSLHFSDLEKAPTIEALAELHASGSGQFSKKGLSAVLKHLGNPIYCTVVDLRQEFHGFLNGIAVSWYATRNWGNFGKSLDKIESDETALLKDTLKKTLKIFRVERKTRDDEITESRSFSLLVETAETERLVTGDQNVNYFRIPVTDHMRPTDENVDRFVTFARDLPSGTWLHFHCEAGDGRTTTFMVMYDMMRNAKKVELADIINRQWLLGGIRLTELPSVSSWKYIYSAERILFLKKFYDYCRRNKDGFRELWSEYSQKAK